MRARMHGLNGPTLREAGTALKADLTTAKTRLVRDARTVAKVGGRRLVEVAKNPAFIAGAAGLIVGAVLGWLLKRRR